MLRKKTMALLIISMALSACSDAQQPNGDAVKATPNAQSSNPVYSKITAEEAYQIMSETDDYVLLDVRTDEEYKEKHIKGAVLIPDYEISARAESELADKNTLILVYCRSGRRSAEAAKTLVGMGYTDVHDFGGIIDWVYEVE